ncbi:MAG: DNA/RNA non-specific endonuclease [Candidatus Goldbacteria bacterium]|nr:DNA/RNA non-specific endonuclease [Candidatus Goldiibacteriota bacterium]
MKKFNIFLLFPIFTFNAAGYSQSTQASPVSITSVALTATVAPTNEHLTYGCPACQGTLLTRVGYVFCYDNTKKVSLGVAYHLTKDDLNGLEKRSNYKFLADPALPPVERAENKDYNKSGYDKGAHVSGRRSSPQCHNHERMLLPIEYVPTIASTQPAPMGKLLVGTKIRALAAKDGEIWVYVGPIFEKDPSGMAFKLEKTIGKNQIWIPWGFYKIVVFKDRGQLQALAFQYMNQDETNDFYAHETTIDNIQYETGLDFLNALSKNMKLTKEKLSKQELNNPLN